MNTLPKIFAATVLFAGTAVLVCQASIMAPTSDEAGHLVSGIATAHTGDPAFYRVNPPLHRLLSGLAVDLAFAPEIPGLYPASSMASGSRYEFRLANDFLTARATDYRRYFVLGRLVRLPIMLLAAWMLWRGVPSLPRRATMIAAFLWVTSPLVLGHGWTIMPDAVSGCAAVFLIISTLVWLRQRDWFSVAIVGVAWGVAISTKFTFCPIYVLWPIGLIAHEWILGNRTFQACFRTMAAHLWAGLIALVVVIAAYGGSELGVPFGEHGFQSHRMRAIGATLGSMPSPFPKQFLVGIDEQQIDLENGYPTYFLGTWYPDGVWWYYLAGLIAKEQLAFSIGLVLAAAGGVVLVRRRTETNAERESLADYVFCVFVGVTVMGILSLHSRMALNVRYVFPALPAIYLAIGIGVSALFSDTSQWGPRLAALIGLVVFTEMSTTFPDHFTYVNPMFGGSYRVPPVLHDSNFDGGQDLWRLENWLADHPAPVGCERYICIHTRVPVTGLKFVPRVPTADLIQEAINEHQVANRSPLGTEESKVEIIVMRGLGVPAHWTALVGRPAHGSLPAVQKRLQELLREQPDEFLTPTLAVFRVSTH